MINRSIIKAPIAKIYVDTPYLKKEVEAVCLDDAAYDLCIGNVEEARNPDDPLIEQCLHVEGSDLDSYHLMKTSKEDLIKMQQEDETINHLELEKPDYFIKKDGILYRKTHDSNQVVIPQTLRQELLAIAHDSPFAGHMGYKKTY